MIVFKTFLKILNKTKSMVILYTVMLVAFAGSQLQTSDNSTNFVESKPDILIVNEGEDTVLTKNFQSYMRRYCNIKEIGQNESDMNDALFYREINYMIFIPENYSKDFLGGKNPEIKVKSTGDYQSSLAEMLVTKYMKVAGVLQVQYSKPDELVKAVNQVLKEDTKVVKTSKLDTGSLGKAAFYFNFANYSLLAGCVFVICLILSSFKEENISKRIMVSSMNYKKHNFLLMCSNALFAVSLWAIYVLLSFVLLGKTMFSKHGALFIINSFVFVVCCLTIALLIGSLVKKKEALNGIINVLALGSSFLCGAFVPMEWLPDGVLKGAHILPSYWYVKNNETIKTMETINMKSLRPFFINVAVVAGFSILFICIWNVVTKRVNK